MKKRAFDDDPQKLLYVPEIRSDLGSKSQKIEMFEIEMFEIEKKK